MHKLLINDDLHFAENTDEVIDLVHQYMGHDTGDYLQNALDESECSGECDETYKIQDHFKRVIQDVIDDLDGLTVAKRQQARLERIKRALQAEL